MVQLKSELLLGDGGERLVFIHPNDNNKVIKVLQPGIKKHNFQNELEFKYYNFFPEAKEKKLLEDLKSYLFKNEILFIDCSSHNVFCKKISEDKYTLIIYDGLGARRDSIKLSLYMKSKLYTKYKIKKQWKLFIKNCEKSKASNLKN